MREVNEDLGNRLEGGDADVGAAEELAWPRATMWCAVSPKIALAARPVEAAPGGRGACARITDALGFGGAARLRRRLKPASERRRAVGLAA